MRAKVIRVVRANHNDKVFILLSDNVSFCIFAPGLGKPQPEFFLEVGDEVVYEERDGNCIIKEIFFR